MLSKPLISIIIRSKNEEQWVGACISKIMQQTIKDIEIILVDSGSTDKTIARAKSVCPDLRLVEIDKFLPGKAINDGIRASSGEYIVCISSHCVPQHDHWLEVLHANFKDNDKLAGVYGRQIPMHFTNPHDKRDLLVTFGLDKKVQHKDPFFHNANSMFPRKIWEDFPFDEEITNIEDRLWAKEVLAAGYNLIYEPEAAAYHHHGIHHGGNIQRARNIVKIMEPDIEISHHDEENPFYPEKMAINAILTVREDDNFSTEILDKLFKKTLQDVQKSEFINRVIVSTDSKRLQKLAIELGAEAPFLRPSDLATSEVRVISVLQHALDWLEENGEYSDYIVLAEITHPFRPPSFFDKCIETAFEKGVETILAGISEYRPCWWLHGEDYQRIDDSLEKRQEREPVQIGLPALCCVTLPALIRNGKRIGEKIGIIDIEDPLAGIQIRSDDDYKRLKGLEITSDKKKASI